MWFSLKFDKNVILTYTLIFSDCLDYIFFIIILLGLEFWEDRFVSTFGEVFWTPPFVFYHIMYYSSSLSVSFVMYELFLNWGLEISKGFYDFWISDF